jgi:hypothetical protein
MAAVVLSLMTASAKSSFDGQNTETFHTAASIRVPFFGVRLGMVKHG